MTLSPDVLRCLDGYVKHEPSVLEARDRLLLHVIQCLEAMLTECHEQLRATQAKLIDALEQQASA